MAFTDVEMAILSQSAYYGFPDGAEKQALYDFLNSNAKKLKKDLGENYFDAIDTLLSKIKNEDYTIVQSMDDKDGTGFAAFAIRDPNNNVTVACRGTEGFSLDYDSKKDVAADIELAYSLSTSQQKQMEKFIQCLESKGYDGYYFTGHSLGGNLATYGAIFLSDPDKLRGCVTFNAPGFNAAFLEKNKFRISRVENRITSFQNERDCVSECFFVIGNVVILECDGWDFLNILGLDAHSLNALVINSDGTFKRNHTGRKDDTVIGYIAEKVTDFTDDVMGFFAPIVIAYDYIQWKKERARNAYRDFSQEAKEMLLGAAKETEDEKWWEVKKWDCWYKVEKFFGTLEWDLYAGNVDSYYRKLIDINDASVKDIERIFENVYGIDNNYATTINSELENLKSKVTNVLVRLKESINVK